MEPFGTAIFCDDIRFESFNKISLIGLYGYELVLFGNLPATLPKLGIFASVRFHKTQKVAGVEMRIYFPGDPPEVPSHFEHLPVQLSPEEFPSPDLTEYPDPSEFYGFNHPFLFSPVVVKQAGYIRVRAIAGDVTIKVGSLKVREASPEEMTRAMAATGPRS